MSAAEIWITIGLMTVITVATRTVMLVFGDRIPLPERVQARAALRLYVIAIYAVSFFFPWIYPLRNWLLLLTHMILGGLVGVVYELLDEYNLPFPVSGA